MATAFELVSFDGNSIGPATAYNVYLHPDDDIVVSGELALMSRRGAGPLVQGTSSPGRVIIVQSQGPVVGGAGAATYRTNIDQWFSPEKNADGPRYLVRYADDATTLIRIPCYVTEKHYSGRGSNAYVITLFSPQPAWEANSSTADSTSPVPNNGNAAVMPSLALTCSTHATRKRFTVTGAGRGGGLKQCPIRFEVDSTALTASNAYCLVSGVSVPFYVGDAGLVTSFVWALVDTPSLASSSTTVDIVYGSGISNSLAGALLPAGRDWSNTGSSNTVWKWDDLTVGRGGAGSGVWRPALLTSRDSGSAGLTSNSTTSIVLSSGLTGSYPNDMDAIVLETGGIGFSALDNVSRQVGASAAGSTARASVRTRDAGSSLITTDWAHTSATGATVTTSIALTNGIQIMIGNVWPTVVVFTLTKAGGTAWALTLADTPTVTLVHTQNLDYYDSTLVIGPTTITFNDFMTEDGTLEITHGESGWTITSSVAGYRFYGPENRITFSDPDVFIALAPGSNVVTNNITGASWTLTYRGGYA